MNERVFLYYSVVRADLDSFPTRRPSDLWKLGDRFFARVDQIGIDFVVARIRSDAEHAVLGMQGDVDTWRNVIRSEEHTSELQSHSDLVCRLLLEKKNRLVYGEVQVLASR